MKTLILGFSLFLFASASAYSPAEFENLSTLIHLVQLDVVSTHSHDEDHHHDHVSGGADHSDHSHGNVVIVSHQHSSQGTDGGSDDTHGHHLDLFSGFAVVFIESHPVEVASIEIVKSPLLEPAQLVSDPHKSRLFRPPIS